VIDGLAVVDKPPGMTSHDVVAACRRLFGQKRVGHAGTLDPDATGVLLVGLGRGTRLLQFQTGLPKSYTAEVVLGVATTTLDAAGEVTARWDQRHVCLEDARRAAASLTGPIWQVPPMVSAVKVRGRRLHEMARQGMDVERPARQVTVWRFDVESSWPGLSDGSGPVLAVRVDCSSGTYVRVLGAELGAALGGGAHVRRLRRTAVGPWTVDAAVPLDALSAADVVPPAASLPWLDVVVVPGERVPEVTNGRVLNRDALGLLGAGPWRLTDPGGALLAVYVPHATNPELVKPAVVLPGPAGEGT
jgi:tRNA pseudouridine55 synthase